jgi:hypothetical protein
MLGGFPSIDFSQILPVARYALCLPVYNSQTIEERLWFSLSFFFLFRVRVRALLAL